MIPRISVVAYFFFDYQNVKVLMILHVMDGIC